MLGQLLFTATFRGELIAIRQATETDYGTLTKRIARDAVSDVLDRWSGIAISTSTVGPHVHILGWRQCLQDTWITSCVVARDPDVDLVKTWSGKTYLLGPPSSPELDRDLWDHLHRALGAWGFEAIRAQLYSVRDRPQASVGLGPTETTSSSTPRSSD